MKTLDLGCGRNKTPGAIGLDLSPDTQADIVHDLAVFPYPLPDNEFDRIVANHVIEHLPDFMGFMAEVHRIAKPGATIRFLTPHYTNPDWPTDPTHRNHFNCYSFSCFTDKRNLFPYYTQVRLRPLRVYVSLANLWRALGIEWLVNLDTRWPSMRFTRRTWEYYFSYLFRGKELQFEFEVIKPENG